MMKQAEALAPEIQAPAPACSDICTKKAIPGNNDQINQEKAWGLVL